MVADIYGSLFHYSPNFSNPLFPTFPGGLFLVALEATFSLKIMYLNFPVILHADPYTKSIPTKHVLNHILYIHPLVFTITESWLFTPK